MTGQPLASSSESAPLAWYIGRDGKQFGPISDGDFRRAWEAGQLQPTDLVWREGFAEWLAVSSLAPPTPAVALRPEPVAAASRAAAAVQSYQQTAPVRRELQPAPQSASPQTARIAPVAAQPHRKAAKPTADPVAAARPRGRVAAILGTLFFLIMLAAAAFVVQGSPQLTAMAKGLIPNFGGGPERIVATLPIGGFAKTAEATDQAMQKSRLWQVLKAYHGEWYTARVKEATEAAIDGKSEGEIATQLLQAVVKLRRLHAGDATAASMPRLRSIASLFASNLVTLKSRSVDTCFQYASNGEGAQAVVALLQSPELTSALQAQLVATFEAVEEGRKRPTIYSGPKQGDFDALVLVLETYGWKDRELRLFSDATGLSKASPETVCRLVTEWFQSQLAVSNSDQQTRLLVDSLRTMLEG